jgi:hypothetical protein
MAEFAPKRQELSDRQQSLQVLSQISLCLSSLPWIPWDIALLLIVQVLA